MTSPVAKVTVRDAAQAVAVAALPLVLDVIDVFNRSLSILRPEPVISEASVSILKYFAPFLISRSV